MNKTLLILILIFSNLTFAQEVYKEYYENGQLQGIGKFDENKNAIGEWKFYFENGQLLAIGKFKDNKKEGEWKFYYENGQLLRVGKFKEDKQIGEWKIYHKNGELKETKTFETRECYGDCEIGFGIEKQKNNWTYYGSFEDNKKEGLGIESNGNDKITISNYISGSKKDISVGITTKNDKIKYIYFSRFDDYDGTESYPKIRLDLNPTTAEEAIKCKFSESESWKTLDNKKRNYKVHYRLYNGMKVEFAQLQDERGFTISSFVNNNTDESMLIHFSNEAVINVEIDTSISALSNESTNRLGIKIDVNSQKMWFTVGEETIFLNDDFTEFPKNLSQSSYYYTNPYLGKTPLKDFINRQLNKK